MRNNILSGLTGLLLPLAAYSAPATYGSYQHRKLTQGISHQPLHTLGLGDYTFKDHVQIGDEEQLTLSGGTVIRELIIVDSSVQDKQLILKQAQPGVAIVEIKPSDDGVEALTQALQGYKNLSAVHVVAHAEAGAMFLGGHRVDQQALIDNVSAFSAINHAIREGGDLLLYGCDLAQGEAGMDFLRILKNNTHVDIAASDDRTGNENYGGNWVLEVQKGNIETPVLSDTLALKDFSGLLFTGTINFSQVRNAGDYGGSASINAEVWTSIAQEYYLIIDGLNGSTDIYSGPHSVGSAAYTHVNETSVTLRFNGDAPFSPQTLRVANIHSSSHTFTFTSSNGSFNLAFGAVNGTNYVRTVDLTPLGANITYVTISSGRVYSNLDNFVVSDVGVTANSPPADINLSSTSVNQSGGTNAVVGTLSTVDNDIGDTHTYTLVAGAGDTHNGSFNINGNQLRANNAAALSAGTYSVRVRTNDGTDTFDKSFTITVVDDVAPTVTSVSVPANGIYSAGQNLDFTVNASENVTVNTGGGTPRIALTIGATTRYATYISGSGTSAVVFRYTIQAGDNDNDGIAVAATLDLDGGTLRDGAGNNLNTTLNSVGVTTGVLVDAVAPTVSSINRVTTSPTNASSVDYTVTFSENVTGVDVSDFTLTRTGTADGSIATVTPVSGSTYTVTVTSISGDGLLRLDLNGAGTGITDTAGNAIVGGYISGQTYHFDNTAPNILSVNVPANGTYIAGQNLDFTVNTTENVTLDTDSGTPRIALTIGFTTRYAEYVSGSGTTALLFRYTIQTDDNDSDGIALAASVETHGGTLRDEAGNDLNTTLNTVEDTAGVLVDAVAPTLESLDPATGATGVLPSANLVITLNEDITLGTGTITIYDSSDVLFTAIDVTNHSGQLATTGAVLTVNLTDDLLEDTGYYVQIASGAITDLAGNAFAGISDHTTWTFTVADLTPPEVTGIDVQGTPGAAEDAITFTVTFNEIAEQISAADFELTATGTAEGVIASVSAASGTSVEVTVNDIAGTGSLRLDLRAQTNIVDAHGNGDGTNGYVPAFTSGEVHDVDHDPPEAPVDLMLETASDSGISDSDGITNLTELEISGSAEADSTVTLSSDQDGDVGSTTADGTGDWTITTDTLSANATHSLTATASDAAGNVSEVSVALTVQIDTTAPAINAIAPAAGAAPADETVAFAVTFSETVHDLALSDFAISATGNVAGTVTGLSASNGEQVTVTVSAISGTGTVRLDYSGTTATDVAGNTLPTFSSGNAHTVDTEAPTLDSATFEPAIVNLDNQAQVSFTLSGAEVDSTLNYAITSDGGAGSVNGSLTVAQADQTVSDLDLSTLPDGTLTLSVTLTDAAGNVSDPVTDTVDKDTLVPEVNNVAVPAAATYTASDVLSFTVQLNKAVTVADGTPSLPITVGATQRQADYVSGTEALIFSYTVQAGDNDSDGITLGTAIALNGSTLRDAAGNDLDLVLNDVADASGVLVDTQAPSLVDRFPEHQEATAAPDTAVVLTFDEPIQLGSGTIAIYDVDEIMVRSVDVEDAGDLLQLSIDNDAFTLTWQPLENLPQEVSYAVMITNAAITDLAGNPYAGISDPNTWTFTVADIVPPQVQSIELQGTPGAADETLTYTVTFNETAEQISAADFELTATGTAEGVIASVSAASGTSVEVTVNDIAGTGSLRLDLRAETNIVDAHGNGDGTNGYVPAFTSGEVHDVDRDPPEAPVDLTLETGSDSGISDSDGITNLTELEISGSAEADSTVTLSSDQDGDVGSTTADGTGDWTITTDTLSANATHSLTATATDAAGNVSEASAALTVQIDTTAPAITTIAPAAGAAPADGTVAFVVTFSETVHNLASTQFSLAATDTAQGTIAELSATTGESVSITVTGISGTGALTLHYSGPGAVDVAGNALPAFTAGSAHAVDTDPPSIEGVTFDQSPVNADNQNAISFTLANAETGTTAHYTISSDGGAGTVSDSVAVNQADQSIGGVDVSALPDGTLTLSLVLEDAAGNQAEAVTTTVTKDALLPQIDSVSLSEGHYKAGDSLTVTLGLSKPVTLSGDSATVELAIGGETRVATLLNATAQSWTFSYSVQPGDNDDSGVTLLANSLQLHGNTAEDASGNALNLDFAALTNPNTLVDTLDPDAPQVLAPAEQVHVNTEAYTIMGSHGEEGVIIYLYTDDNQDGLPDNDLALASDTVTGGTWQIEQTLTFNADNRFVVVAEDAARNASEPVSVPVIVHDNIAPDAPESLTLHPDSDSGISDSDRLTRFTELLISGTAEPGSTVTLNSDIDGELGSVTVDEEGDWQVTTDSMSDGEHQLTATATDAAGNSSELSDGLTVTVDTQAPALSELDDVRISLAQGSAPLEINLSDNVTAGAALDLSVTSDNSDVLPESGLTLAGEGATRTLTIIGAGPGQATISLAATDEAGNTATTGFAVVVNTPPSVSGVPSDTVLQDQPYSFRPTANDADGDPLSFSINQVPQWANFDPATGTLSGTPGREHVGVFSDLVISVSDGLDSISLPAFAVEVLYVNAPPVISGTPPTSVDQDQLYSFVPSASDPDSGDTLTFSISNLPTWASFDTATGALNGTPTREHVGLHQGIVISVSDGTDSTSLPAFAIEVSYVNAAPEISGTPPATAMVNEPYSFMPSASDPDGDALTFSAAGLPNWLTLNPQTGALTGTPQAQNEGVSGSITLTVSDGELSASLPPFTIAVAPFEDLEPPQLTAPPDRIVDARALFTTITLRQLLNLPADANAEQLQAALAALTTDNVDGDGCCAPTAEGFNDGQRRFRPGRHEIVWRAQDNAGNETETVQVLYLRPMVSLSKDQVSVPGARVTMRVILNGPSPFYPLEVPYTLDVSSTATDMDHDLLAGTVVFAAGETEKTVNIQLLEPMTTGAKTLVVRLDDRDDTFLNRPYSGELPDLYHLNAGASNRHEVRILEGNIPPKVDLWVSQGDLHSMLITAQGGPVTVNAQVTDPNPGDTHSFDWSATSNSLTSAAESLTGDTLEFDPSGLSPGRYLLQVVVTDSGGASGRARLPLRVMAELPVLSPDNDSNGNGIDDLTEGFGDLNGNGIPNYLDSMPSVNVLPQVIVQSDNFLLECDPGVRCRIGSRAMLSESGGVQLLEEDFELQEDLPWDEDYQSVGGVFDFEMHDLLELGQNVRVVIPQRAAIPAQAVYRKLINGQWQDFVEDEHNILHSAPGEQGYCPPPGGVVWQPGLVEGFWCVQLTIQDGGPNDADGERDGSVSDPGAVASAILQEPPAQPPEPPETKIHKTKGSGALGWPMMMLLGFYLVRRVRVGRWLVLAALMLPFSVHAQDWQQLREHTYVQFSVYQAEGSQSAHNFESAMAQWGQGVDVLLYDRSRTAFQIALGFAWTEHSAVELGYLDLGTVKVDFATESTNAEALNNALSRAYPRSGRGVTTSYRYTYEVLPRTYLSGAVGLYWWNGSISEIEGNELNPSSPSSVDPLVNVRLAYDITQSVNLGVDWQKAYFGQQSVDMVGLSLGWNW